MDIRRKPKIIVKEIERLISLNLDERAAMLMRKHYRLLSNKNIRHIANYMFVTGQHSYRVWRDIWVDPFAEGWYLLRVSSVYDSNNLDLVRFCLTNSPKDTDISFGLYGACSNGHIDMVRLFLEDIRISNDALMYGFIDACLNGWLNIVQLFLLDGRCDPSSNQDNALFAACSNGHTAIVKLLLCDSRVDPSSEQYTALILAIIRNHTDVMRLLMLDERVDPAANNNAALCRAATSPDCADAVKLLLLDGRVRSGDLDRAQDMALDRRYIDIAEIIGCAIFDRCGGC